MAQPISTAQHWRLAIFCGLLALLPVLSGGCFTSDGLDGSRVLRIEQQGMEPTLPRGAQVVAMPIQAADIKRGDIVVFSWPDDIKTIHVKRVIGLPGDTVVIRDNIVSINGKPLDEPYLAPGVTTRSFAQMEWKLGDDDYFLLGDGREKSADSRLLGPVPADNITHRVVR